MSGHQSIDLPENRHGQEPENTGSGGKKTESSILPHAPHPQLSVEIITTLIDVERGEEASNSELCRAISAIEELDRQDVTMASEYSDDIFRYMRELELKMLPSHDYMDRQPELQWYMRRILFDWIVQVHERFTLLPETLYLCVNLIDRFLSVKEVSTDKLQLVGITALFIAAKYEELDAPSVSSMVYMTDETYTRDELQKAERYMINLLNYELGFPGPLNFLRRISKSDEYDLSIRTLAKYLVEVTIMYECFIAYPPSLIAACCYYAALRILRKKHWTSTHVHYSGYQEVSLIYCTNQLLMCLEDSTLHTSVYNKYGSSRYMFVSQYVTEYLASCKDK
ncbi:hypothetical protein K493DRAFT_229690 [Basidiobolus meristosporus CBS 931.73]|uniref:Uncharacterized protein n=1 Tax=Basidiobolus meristosporus CBS 931.73 TaxID=1314790 RepID=A0A1Y1XYF3_9FUNG|nr:hypothetical protein K493DRAFT_229690 [Basidiobolus meristosporus CBS 931.73]|eukprot:ORX90771.1 hypothetical protein K493DRAFT_229690 [Basidiobolus meristosporus CBS 931.73]